MPLPMKSENAPVRLEDYRAPAFTIDTVALDFRLDPEKTLVKTTMPCRPSTDEAQLRRLERAGDETKLVGIALDGAPRDPGRYEATPDRLVVRDVPNGPF